MGSKNEEFRCCKIPIKKINKAKLTQLINLVLKERDLRSAGKIKR